VQVRTRLQDTWAQIVERLADVFGRQIRYGEPPTDPDVEVVPDLTRQALISLLISLSKTSGELEEADAVLARVEREAEATGEVDAAFLASVSEERAEIVQTERRTHDVLERLHAVLQRAQAIDIDGLS
jgi:N-acyl-D-aspartate/D-glutamate deacylase